MKNLRSNSELVKEMKSRLTDSSCSDDANLQHVLHVFAGYRSTMMNDEETQPYSPGSARQLSFEAGVELAEQDKENMDEKFTLNEFREYIRSCDSFGDVFHYLNAKRIREVNQPKSESNDEE